MRLPSVYVILLVGWLLIVAGRCAVMPYAPTWLSASYVIVVCFGTAAAAVIAVVRAFRSK